MKHYERETTPLSRPDRREQIDRRAASARIRLTVSPNTSISITSAIVTSFAAVIVAHMDMQFRKNLTSHSPRKPDSSSCLALTLPVLVEHAWRVPCFSSSLILLEERLLL